MPFTYQEHDPSNIFINGQRCSKVTYNGTTIWEQPDSLRIKNLTPGVHSIKIGTSVYKLLDVSYGGAAILAYMDNNQTAFYTTLPETKAEINNANLQARADTVYASFPASLKAICQSVPVKSRLNAAVYDPTNSSNYTSVNKPMFVLSASELGLGTWDEGRQLQYFNRASRTDFGSYYWTRSINSESYSDLNNIRGYLIDWSGDLTSAYLTNGYSCLMGFAIDPESEVTADSTTPNQYIITI